MGNFLTPQSRRNCWVNAAVNSGPPSDANSSAMPYVTKNSRSFLTSAGDAPVR